jgi:hypothetical protein
MSTVQCMGGWCRSRERCQHYRARRVPGHRPVERLCGAKEQPLEIRVRAHLPATAHHSAPVVVAP